MLIEDTKTTQNREIISGLMKGKMLQRERACPDQEVYKKCELEGQESSTITCEKSKMAVGNSHLEVDNWDFLNKEI